MRCFEHFILSYFVLDFLLSLPTYDTTTTTTQNYGTPWTHTHHGPANCLSVSVCLSGTHHLLVWPLPTQPALTVVVVARRQSAGILALIVLGLSWDCGLGSPRTGRILGCPNVAPKRRTWNRLHIMYVCSRSDMPVCSPTRGPLSAETVVRTLVASRRGPSTMGPIIHGPWVMSQGP
ncbi:hypothetical protein F5B22DRAFT_481902 [Xylaria bambusicola]|uniref:uncharacterized protein n=1 Tax=Xylaria bambusicola TaxID=326684 RepID=UPI002008B0C6|nr:uncharacterized protein F5B22DRAFT_481902 [Xylaria bambusicola]KAI0506047.1 hypothetical protein F5B22DRAFT_481902 [Xylaria bambusicola]